MANERFDSSIGEHYSPTYIAGLSDKELADEITMTISIANQKFLKAMSVSVILMMTLSKKWRIMKNGTAAQT